MIAILRRRVMHNIWAATLKVKVTSWPWNKMCSAHNFVIWSQNLKLFTEMIALLEWCVMHNIWVATLKVKVTSWLWSKIVSGP